MTATQGILLGLLIGILGTAAFAAYRVQSLAAVDFTLTAPPVPPEVVRAVRSAEHGYYASQGPLRRAAEGVQDMAAILHPPLVYALDFSVGPFHLKGRTLDETIPWAIEQGYLQVHDAPARDFHWLYVYLAEQPGLADWGAAVHLEWLRQKHPGLRALTWDEIAADPRLVAKVYSGYVGAGGDWEAWEADLTPGPVAAARLGLTAATDTP